MMAFKLPDLPYGYDALEPHIDARTMEIHYTKHHNGYVTNLNKAIEGTDLENKSLVELMLHVSNYSTAVRNNGGGHYNHSLFWKVMSPNGGGEPSAQMNIAKAINQSFGSFSAFKEQFANAAATRFGSGWAWLCVSGNDELFITSTPNQDNPLMDVAEKRGMPILGLDVWEHAYYLNYQNRRPDYIQSFFNLINWQEVTENYNEANKGAMKL
ncbi:MAG: superoxide dismutase [Lewinellaceae bacterium]|nr:superoxide dismutase [Lewinellaceae bacterium]